MFTNPLTAKSVPVTRSNSLDSASSSSTSDSVEMRSSSATTSLDLHNVLNNNQEIDFGLNRES